MRRAGSVMNRCPPRVVGGLAHLALIESSIAFKHRFFALLDGARGEHPEPQKAEQQHERQAPEPVQERSHKKSRRLNTIAASAKRPTTQASACPPASVR